MPTISLDIDARGAKRGASEAENALNRVKTAAKGAEDATDKINKGFSGLSASAGKLKSVIGLLGGAFTALGTSSLLKAGTDALNFADDLNASAQAIGITAEKLQVFRGKFQEANIDIAATDNSLRAFTRNIGLAADGTGPAASTFEKLGISLRDSAGNIKDGATIFDEVSDAIAKISSTQEQAAAASRLFGRDIGTRLVSTLKEGSASFAEFEQRAKASGAVISNEVVQAADDANSRMEALRASIGNTFKGAFLKEFTGEFSNVNQALSDSAEAFRLLGIAAGKTLALILDGIGKISNFVSSVKAVPSQISTGLEFVGERLKPGKFQLGNISSDSLETELRSTKRIAEGFDPTKDQAAIEGAKRYQASIEGILNTRKGLKGALDVKDFGGFRAAGGPVDPNKYYVVGENGPELFTPSEAGNIVAFGNSSVSGRRTDTAANLAKVNAELQEQGVLLEENSRTARVFADTLNQSLQSVLSDASGGRSQSIGSNLRSFGLNLLSNLGSNILLPRIEGAFTGLANNLFGNTGPSSSYLVGGGGMGLSYGGARAMGGSVRGYRSYLVGENGPEMFTPSLNGNISPGVGGTTVVVNVQAKDAQSFIQSRSQVAAAVNFAVRQGAKNL